MKKVKLKGGLDRSAPLELVVAPGKYEGFAFLPLMFALPLSNRKGKCCDRDVVWQQLVAFGECLGVLVVSLGHYAWGSPPFTTDHKYVKYGVQSTPEWPFNGITVHFL